MEQPHFYCGECLEPFICPILVTIHFQVEHELRCACEQLFSNKLEILQHMERDGCRFPFAIQISIPAGSEKENPEMESMEGFDRKSVYIQKTDKGFRCHLCGILCASQFIARQHLKHAHGHSTTNQRACDRQMIVERFIIPVGEVLVCMLCGKPYLEAKNVYKHLYTEHKSHVSNVNEDLYKTTIVTGGNVPANHLYKRLKNKKLRCLICRNFANTLPAITKHLRKHSSIIKDRLSELLNNFQLQTQVKEGMSGTRVVACDEQVPISHHFLNGTCASQVKSKSSLQASIRRNHEEVEFLTRYIAKETLFFRCRLCFTKSTKKSYLYQHLQKKHENVLSGSRHSRPAALDSKDGIMDKADFEAGQENDLNVELLKTNIELKKTVKNKCKQTAPGGHIKASSVLNAKHVCRKIKHKRTTKHYDHINSLIFRSGDSFCCRKCKLVTTRKQNMRRHVKAKHFSAPSHENKKVCYSKMVKNYRQFGIKMIKTKNCPNKVQGDLLQNIPNIEDVDNGDEIAESGLKSNAESFQQLPEAKENKRSTPFKSSENLISISLLETNIRVNLQSLIDGGLADKTGNLPVTQKINTLESIQEADINAHSVQGYFLLESLAGNTLVTDENAIQEMQGMLGESDSQHQIGDCSSHAQELNPDGCEGIINRDMDNSLLEYDNGIAIDQNKVANNSVETTLKECLDHSYYQKQIEDIDVADNKMAKYACVACRDLVFSRSGWYRHLEVCSSCAYSKQPKNQEAASLILMQNASESLASGDKQSKIEPNVINLKTKQKKLSWLCVICQLHFGSYGGWRSHFKHCRRKRLGKIGQHLPSKSEIAFLRKNCLKKGSKFECSFCGLKYKRCPDLYAHIRTKHDMVDQTETNDNSLKGNSHQYTMDTFTRQDSSESASATDYCTDIHNSETDLRNHLTVRSCTFCHFQFASYNGWYQHTKLCKERQTRRKDVFEVEFLEKNGMKKSSMFMCHICKHEFKCSDDAYFHICREHGSTYVTGQNAETMKPLASGNTTSKLNTSGSHDCSKLKSETQGSLDLDIHEQERKFIRSQILFKKGLFVCSICNTSCKLRSSIFKHVRRKHLANIQSAVKCSGMADQSSTTFQPKKASAKGELKVKIAMKYMLSKMKNSQVASEDLSSGHVKHLNKSVMKSCAQCAKRFMTLRNLMNHIASAHMKYPVEGLFQCSFCSRSFKQRHNGVTHFVYAHCLKTATQKKKRHHCRICNIDFVNKFQRNYHLSEVHSDVCVSCPGCEVICLTKSDIFRHIYRSHPKQKQDALLRKVQGHLESVNKQSGAI